MIQVVPHPDSQGDPLTILARGYHHARGVVPVVEHSLYALLMQSSLARDNHVHKLFQSKRGAGSWALYLADGREYHFRAGFSKNGGGYDCLDVYDRYKSSRYYTRKQVAKLTSKSEARRFFRHLRNRQTTLKVAA
jgi:hypothetical protein